MFPNLEHIARVDQRIVPPSSSPPFWITSGQTWICIYIYSTIMYYIQYATDHPVLVWSIVNPKFQSSASINVKSF